GLELVQDLVGGNSAVADDADAGDVFTRCRERWAGRITLFLFLAEHRFRQGRHAAAGHALRIGYRGHARHRGNKHCQCDEIAKMKDAVGQVRVTNRLRTVRGGETLRLNGRVGCWTVVAWRMRYVTGR